MDERIEAAADLARIRALMERAGRYSNLSGCSLVLAGLIATAGVLTCAGLGVDFSWPGHARLLGIVWSAVLALAAAQHVAFTVVHARRQAEPVWSPLTRQVVVAMLPALFIGAALTGFGLQTGQLDLLPPAWMLAHGSSLMALGLYAGGRLQLAGLAFLAMGAATLWWGKPYGLWLLLPSFGGIHLLLGLWMLWKPRG